MTEETMKKLGFCEAFEHLFATDEFQIKSSITEDSGEYDAWQNSTEEEHRKIEQYKGQFIAFYQQVLNDR